MQHSAIIRHKDGFNVEAWISFDKNQIELRKLGEHTYFKGDLDSYTNFAGNLQDFVNLHEF